MPTRIYEIARRLGVDSLIVLKKAKELGITNARVPSSSLDRITAEYLEEKLAYLKVVAPPSSGPRTPTKTTSQLPPRVEAVPGATPRGLRQVGLGNFKTFAELQSVPIRPLTLIFGANSSGKSSFIHGLLLARHAIDTNDLDVSRTEIGGDSVDLGGFRQYIHRRDGGRRVEWVAELDVASLKGQAKSVLERLTILQEGMTARVGLTFGVPLDDKGQAVANAQPRLMTYEIEAGGINLLRLSRRPDGSMHLDRLNRAALLPLVEGVLLNNMTTEKIEANNDLATVWQAVEDLIPTLRFTAQGFLPSRLAGDEYVGGPMRLVPVGKAERQEMLAGSVKLFIPRAIAEVILGVNAVLTAQLGCLRYLGPLRSCPPRHLAFAEDKDRNWFAGGGFAWDVVAKDEKVRKRLNDWLGDPDCLQTRYRLDVIRYITPGERERAIIEESLALAPEWKAGELIEDPRREESKGGITITHEETGEKTHLVNPAALDFERISQVVVNRLLAGSPSGGIDELVLRDMRTDTVVSHRDVGIGVSQVLPVLVHAFADREQIVAIEQPEIHLHPSLQADLADAFIESALGERKNTFILETHSEHLILRILRRVRETTEGKVSGWPGIPVRPEDVTVVFVEPTAKGSIIRHMPVTPDGDFGAPWPGGFFEERGKELF